jgi:alpha-tubulin suppressor-like RCC1 family protein
MRCALLCLLVATAACSQVTSDFTCMTSNDCVGAAGEVGRCETTNRCSVPDATCSTGYRYGQYAGQFSDQCTSAAPTTTHCIADVRAGVTTTCVRTNDQSVWCWGDGAVTPWNLSMPMNPIGLDVGGAGTCVWDGDGNTWCSGVSIAGVAAKQVAVGAGHVCAVTLDGDVACWGSNSHGELGDGTRTARTAPANVLGLHDIRFVASGGATTCATNNGGEVWCWGNDSLGQLGRGTSIDADSLVPVQAAGVVPNQLPPSDIVAVGDDFSCALTRDGEVWCWGNDQSGEIGLGSVGITEDWPRRVPGLAAIVQISSGGGHTCAIDAAGQLWCWGVNAFDECGGASPLITSPTLIVDAAGHSLAFDQIDAGSHHTCARTKQGVIECWGRNVEGEIGDGSFDPASNPTPSQLACE